MWYTWNNIKLNPNTYLDHSQWKMTIIFSLASTDVLKFIVIPHRKLGMSEPVLVIKMNLLVSENYLSHFPTLIWQLSFRSGTVLIDIGKKFQSSKEVGVLRTKKFKRNRVLAKYFSRQLGEQQSKLYSPSRKYGCLGRQLSFFPGLLVSEEKIWKHFSHRVLC